MIFAAKLVAFIAFIVAGVWFFQSPGFDSGVTTIGLLAAFLASLFITKKEIQPNQTQNILDDGQGIQAGRDIHINKLGKK